MSRAWGAWERFWFEPRSLAPLVLVRIGFGLLVTAWALSVLPDAGTFFGDGGVLEDPASRPGAWSLLHLWSSDVLAVGLVAAMAIAGLLLAAGIGGRLTALVVFAGFMSLSTRNPAVGNSGDALLRALSFYVLLAPVGAAFVLWPRNGEIPRRAPWALRLIQIQLSLIYLFTVWAKIRGDTWVDGTAVSYALRLEDLARFPLPDLGATLVLAHVLTYGVLVVELALGVLVWNRRLRPWVLLGGVLLHLGIEYRLRVGFFSWTMLVLYLSFVPEDVAERVLDRGRRWLRSPQWVGSG